ncbi:MAG: DMT family transporter [Rhodospirillaceae bacterium]|nr:DMT family transporter [Rhodospirillaceae bacterium]
MQLALIAMCILAGALLPAQAAMNAAIGLRTSGALFAVGVNFFTGTIVMACLLTALRTPWPTPQQFSAVPWWAWASGMCGIGVVFTTLFAAPRLGATVAFGLIIGGQVLMSLLCDTFGWLNFQQTPLTPGRMAGAALLVAGVVMIRKL